MAEWVEIGKYGADDRWWCVKDRYNFYVESDYTVRSWSIIVSSEVGDDNIVAGPFESLDAAKAALLMLSESNHSTN